jgi:hypothetical protein
MSDASLSSIGGLGPSLLDIQYVPQAETHPPAPPAQLEPGHAPMRSQLDDLLTPAGLDAVVTAAMLDPNGQAALPPVAFRKAAVELGSLLAASHHPACRAAATILEHSENVRLQIQAFSNLFIGG